MTGIKEQIEDLLSDTVKKWDCVPEGSTAKAVIHQWIHALHSDSRLFAQSSKVNKASIRKVLKQGGFLTEKGKLKKAVMEEFHLKPGKDKSLKFIDLFAGIGGMRLGFESVGGACVFSSEFEKNAQATYAENHGEFPFGDITKISEEDIPDHDVLVAGFPCQPFSHAGLKLGIDDTRGTLFHDIARILKKKKPKFALLENVKGLISHDKGHTLQVILKVLTDMGYRCSIDKKVIDKGNAKEIQKAAAQMVLRSRDFGIPQNRQRIFIVLWKKDLDCKFEYPAPLGKKTRVGDILEKNPDEKYTISKRLWDGHQRRKIENTRNGKGFGFSLVSPDSEYTNTISARYYKDGSEILVAQKRKNPRKITPREAARLQGFPEGFILNKSEVQAYKQFGNSVSVPVIGAVAEKIKHSLEGV